MPSSARTSPAHLQRAHGHPARRMSSISTKLNAEGTLNFAGPFLDADGKPNGSLVVVEAETDRRGARARRGRSLYQGRPLRQRRDQAAGTGSSTIRRAGGDGLLAFQVRTRCLVLRDSRRRRGEKGTEWNGVRNYLGAQQHAGRCRSATRASSTIRTTGSEIVGIVEVCALSHPDLDRRGRSELGLRRHPRRRATCRSPSSLKDDRSANPKLSKMALVTSMRLFGSAGDRRGMDSRSAGWAGSTTRRADPAFEDGSGSASFASNTSPLAPPHVPGNPAASGERSARAVAEDGGGTGGDRPAAAVLGACRGPAGQDWRRYILDHPEASQRQARHRISPAVPVWWRSRRHGVRGQRGAWRPISIRGPKPRCGSMPASTAWISASPAQTSSAIRN